MRAGRSATTIGSPLLVKRALDERDFVCGICKGTLAEPVVVRCRHRFCAPCLEQRVSAASAWPVECPVCSKPIASRLEIQADERLAEMLNRGNVRCSNRDAGCAWEGERRLLAEHRLECAFAPVLIVEDAPVVMSVTTTSTTATAPSIASDHGDDRASTSSGSSSSGTSEQPPKSTQEIAAASSSISVADEESREYAEKMVDEILGSRVYALDVGHQLFRATERTLRAEPGSVLDLLFGGSRRLPRGSYHLGFDELVVHDGEASSSSEQQRVFLDCDPVAFQHVLHWLRIGELPKQLSERELDSLLATAKLLGLKRLQARLLEATNHAERKRFTATQVQARIAASNSLSSTNGVSMKKADLSGEWLSGLDLRRAKFNDALLDGTNLQGSNLECADLSGVQARDAEFDHANMTSAVLTSASLCGSSCQKTRMHKADLSRCNLSDATLVECDLSHATLSATNLSRATLDRAIMAHARFDDTLLPDRLLEVDLSNADLTQADLSNRTLSACTLAGARLERANLADTDLTTCNVRGASFASATLDRAALPNDLSSCDLSNCDLSRTALANPNLLNLSHCKLDNTVFGRDLRGADLSHCDLSHHDLSDLELEGANLSHCDLTNTRLPLNLSQVNLSGVDLGNRDLSGYRLTRACLDNASLANCNMMNANLNGASLRNTNLLCCNLTSASLSDAVLDACRHIQTAKFIHTKGMPANETLWCLICAQEGHPRVPGSELRIAPTSRTITGYANQHLRAVCPNHRDAPVT